MSNGIRHQRRSVPFRRLQGFTLLEVLIAMVIVSLGLLGLSAMTLSTLRGLAFSAHTTTATNLAQEKMEAIKSVDYHRVTQDRYPLEDYNTIAGFSRFRREVTIRDGPLVNNTKTAIVRVMWKRQNSGTSHEVTIQTIISR